MSRDLERSLKDRIKLIAKAQNRPFNDIWKTLILERFLARLSRSSKLDQMIFKGGFLLSKYLRLGRETIDLDFSVKNTPVSADIIKTLIKEILEIENNDGFVFTDLKAQEVSHLHMNYPGYEVSAVACLGQTKTAVRIDLGVGDRVGPESMIIQLLSHNRQPLFEDTISLRVYPLTYIFAEKLETIVYRGGSNGRMKDFYDILMISELENFRLAEIQEVVRSVFAHRSTPLAVALDYDDQAIKVLSANWQRFLRALQPEFSKELPYNFSDV